MWKNAFLALATSVAVALPATAPAQIGLAARAGTLGLGGEAAIALGSHLAVRGGVGVSKYTLDVTVSTKKYDVAFPDQIWNVGVDFFPTSAPVHFSAGVMNRPSFDVTGHYTGSARIGNNTYTGDITVLANMKNENETGPFFGVGIGRTAKKGLGFSVDLGAALLGDGIITVKDYTCRSGATDCTSLISATDVEAERARIETQMNDKGYAKVHPILSFSLHFGL